MKMKKAILALGLVLLSAIGLYGCGKSRELTRVSMDDATSLPQNFQPIDDTGSPNDATENTDSATSELTALADTREEAEKIAELYGIKLSAYSYGVATYTTDKGLREIMDLGIENDYPTLTPNYESKLHTEQ